METPRLVKQTTLLNQEKPHSQWKTIDETTDALMVSGIGSLVRCQLNGLFTMVVVPNAYIHPVNDAQGDLIRYRLGEY